MKILLSYLLIFWFYSCGQDPAFTEMARNNNFDNQQSEDDRAIITDLPNDKDNNSVNNNNNNNNSYNTSDENISFTEEKCKQSDIILEECLDNYKLISQKIRQPQARPVDILWIVDNSGSMSEEQQYLGDNFNSFISGLSVSNVDFQVAVTSTDVCNDDIPEDLTKRACPIPSGENHQRGLFIGNTGNKVLDANDPDLIDLFRQYTNIGIDGSGFEHGLSAAYLALKKSLSGENEAFIRNDAFLSIIVVSDEEDDGIGLSKPDGYSNRNYWDEGLTRYKYTDSNFIDYLKSIKGQGNFAISTITGTPDINGDPCISAHSAPNEIGTQYINAAQKTGGMVRSICDTNWDLSLSKLGADLNAQITQIILEKIAAPDTIKVFVNGIISTDWKYNNGNNSVKFNADHVPEPGALIRIEYLGHIK